MSPNLSLCQTTNERSVCLEADPSGNVSVQEHSASENWRFQDGLLRSVNTDGLPTDKCLGPMVSTLDGATTKPYELVLQDCPVEGLNRRLNENIFTHANDFTTDIATDIAMDESYAVDENGLHMRFLIVGDGRVASLAPVTDADEFCITSMNSKAVLAPCLNANETLELGEKVKQDQQMFDASAGSSFEPFLIERPSQDKSVVEFAYQIGYLGGYPELYESYEITVTNGDHTIVSETTVTQGKKPLSGLLTLSDFDAAGTMDAHLVGNSMGVLESKVLASTSFEVHIDAVNARKPVAAEQSLAESDALTGIHKYTNGWTWALITFGGFMLLYFCLIKTNGIFCPSKTSLRRKELEKNRDEIKEEIKECSARTNRTCDNSISQIGSRSRDEADWGGFSGRSARSTFDSGHSRLHRISEEKFPDLEAQHTFATVASESRNDEYADDASMDSTAGGAEGNEMDMHDSVLSSKHSRR